MTQVRLNDFIYSVEDGLTVAEYEIRELVCFDIRGDYTSCLFKIDDGSEIAIFSDGTISECSDVGRVFFLDRKKAVQEALNRVEGQLDWYASMTKDLEEMVKLKKELKEELNESNV